MNAKEFYIEAETEKNPHLEEQIKDHADELDEIFELMEDYAHKRVRKFANYASKSTSQLLKRFNETNQ